MVCLFHLEIELKIDLSRNSLGQLIKIIRQPQMEMVVDKLIEFSGGKDEELRDISGLGMFSVPLGSNQILTGGRVVQRSKRLLQNCPKMARSQPPHVRS